MYMEILVGIVVVLGIVAFMEVYERVFKEQEAARQQKLLVKQQKLEAKLQREKERPYFTVFVKALIFLSMWLFFIVLVVVLKKVN